MISNGMIVKYLLQLLMLIGILSIITIYFRYFLLPKVNVCIFLMVMFFWVTIRCQLLVSCGYSKEIYLMSLFAGVGGYSYLYEPLWWVGMITSEFYFVLNVQLIFSLVQTAVELQRFVELN